MIECNHVYKTYGSTHAVCDVSFQVLSGEIFGLLGPNGAGKTTMIKMLSCLARPDKGSIKIAGLPIEEHPVEVKKRMGVVPQENNLDRDLSVEENLYIYCKLYGLKNVQDLIKESLLKVDLYEKRKSKVITLSGGMKRRLTIARALITNPSVLFLDEPSVGLDPQIRRSIWETIRAHSAKGTSVFLTTHYIEEAEAICARVGMLSHGKLVALDTPSKLKERFGGTLEEVFLKLTGEKIS